MSIPEGYKLVPVEPTVEMNKEGMRWLTGFQHLRANDKRNALTESFKSMLAAAPASPQAAQPVTDDTFIRGWEVGSRLFRTRKEAHKYITTGQSDTDGNGDSLEPLYRANHADAGEVERLRDRNESLEYQASHNSEVAISAANQVSALRAQLAERDALLRGLVEYADGLLSDVNNAWAYAGSTGAKEVHKDDDYAKAVALLSTTAKPETDHE